MQGVVFLKKLLLTDTLLSVSLGAMVSHACLRNKGLPVSHAGGKPKKPSVHNFAELYVAHIGEAFLTLHHL